MLGNGTLTGLSEMVPLPAYHYQMCSGHGLNIGSVRKVRPFWLSCCHQRLRHVAWLTGLSGVCFPRMVLAYHSQMCLRHGRQGEGPVLKVQAGAFPCMMEILRSHQGRHLKFHDSEICRQEPADSVDNRWLT